MPGFAQRGRKRKGAAYLVVGSRLRRMMQLWPRDGTEEGLGTLPSGVGGLAVAARERERERARTGDEQEKKRRVIGEETSLFFVGPCPTWQVRWAQIQDRHSSW